MLVIYTTSHRIRPFIWMYENMNLVKEWKKSFSIYICVSIYYQITTLFYGTDIYDSRKITLSFMYNSFAHTDIKENVILKDQNNRYTESIVVYPYSWLTSRYKVFEEVL